MKLLMKVTAIFDRTIGLLALLAAIIYISIMLLVLTQIGLRYFMGLGISWVLEITEYGLLFMTFLGAAWLLKREGHVKMDIVLTRLKPRTQSLVNIITSILGAITMLPVVWYGVKVTWHSFQMGYQIESLLLPPEWPILAIIPVGSFLLFMQFLRRAWEYLKRGEVTRPRIKAVV